MMTARVDEPINSAGSLDADRIRRERDSLSLLLNVTNLLVTRRDLPSLLHALSDCVARVIPHDYASVGIYPDYANTPRLLRAELVVLDGKRVVALEGREFMIRADSSAQLATGQPLVFDMNFVEKNNPTLAQALGPLKLRSFCSLELRTARRTIGTLNVGSRQADAFNSADVQLLQQISGQIAIALENASSYAEQEALKERLANERDRLSLLLEVTNLLVTQRDLPSLLHALSNCVSQVIPHDYVSVVLYPDFARDPCLLRYYLVMIDGTRRTELEGREFRMREDTVAMYSSGQPLVFDITVIEQRNPPVARLIGQFGIRSFCSVPLRTARRTLGLFVVGSRQTDPFGPAQVELLHQISGQIAIAIENALSYAELEALKERLANENLYLEEEVRSQHGFMDIVGNSRALREVLAQVETVAATDATVLLLGETGTGKELLARAVHDRSPRRTRPFVKVNCAAIPAPLLEGEMFGHERGAFTGAVSARAGRLEVADKGTFFLDEVGDLPLEIQAKMLRALQEHEFERLGSSRTVRVDVRVIAATNRPLGSMVESGQFRADLFYRLNVFPIWIPPLRERPEDIPLLVRYLVAKHAKRLKRPIVTIPTAVMDELLGNDWPGNVRELENVIERAVILSPEGSLRLPPSRASIRRPRASHREAPGRLDDIERDAIVAALQAANGVISGNDGAAAKLGLKRTTLQSRMRKLGIQRRYQ